MRKLVVVLTATAAILLVSSVAWKADAQTAPGNGSIIEMVIKPCLPGMPRNQCGISLRVVQGSATFTTTNGQTIAVQSGQLVGVTGNGTVTQSTQAATILNFAAAGNLTTGSTGTGTGTGTGLGGGLGGGGGGGGGTTGSIPSGGANGGATASAGTGGGTGTGAGLGGLTGGTGGAGGGVTSAAATVPSPVSP